MARDEVESEDETELRDMNVMKSSNNKYYIAEVRSVAKGESQHNS